MARSSAWPRISPSDLAGQPVNRLRIDGAFLRSAVARRVLLSFLLAAFLPSVAMAVVGWLQLNEVVTRLATRQLDQAASAYGRSTYDRLLGGELMLGEIARPLRAGGPVTASGHDQTLGQFFRAVTLHRENQSHAILGNPLAPVDLTASQRDWLANGKTLLLDGVAPGPLLLLAVDPKSASAGMLAAEMDRGFVWGDTEMLPGQTDLCVVDSRMHVLGCSSEQHSTLSVRMAAEDIRASAEVPGGFNVGRWKLFLKPRFDSAEWTFVTLQPREIGQASVSRIVELFARIAALAVFLAALLSMVQIRRILGPIEQLTDATRQLRHGRLERPLEIARDDEFGQLAQSFNGMAGQLAFQFDSLEALSALDTQILAHADTDDVIDAVQVRLLGQPGVACVGVMIVDRDAPDGGTLYVRQSVEQPMTSVRVPLEQDRFDGGAVGESPSLFDASSSDAPTAIALMRRLGAARCCALRAGVGDERRVILILGSADDARLPEQLVDHARALGDRIQIALTASAREEQLVYQAQHDSLTRLPNRLLLLDRMALELAHTQRDKTQLAMLFIDLDRFKYVNDVFGHPAGDELLNTVGERLRACVRGSDTVARLGGDEFVVMLSGVQSARDVAQVAGQILRFVGLPMTIGGKEISVGASIGIALAPADGDEPSVLLKHADIAMYRAKEGGRGRFVFFEERMNTEVVERANIERELRLAVPRRQLRVVYQPRVSIATGRLRGVEALVRWTHPEFGAVPPMRFIPIAEEIGVIQDIGLWVLQTACRQAAEWRNAGVAIESISVNVSGAQLLANDWVERVGAALQDSGLPPGALELEVTENVLLDNEEAVIDTLHRIKQLGVRLALDDFGTGYSSMGYLRRMPVDVMKIDRTFIADLEHDESSRGIARAMIAMARSLKMSVVAEGIESRGQADMLREWSCDEAQGFYYSEPVEADAVAGIARRESDARPAANTV